MFIKILKILKYIFENGPNLAFWVGVLYIFYGWYSQQSILEQLFFITIPMIAIGISVMRIFKETKQQILSSAVLTTTKRKTIDSEVDRIRLLQGNVPSNNSLRTIYNYAQNYASRWASDGEVLEVNYYIDIKTDSIVKTAQIFIQSRKRGERLTKYLPSMSEGIEELQQDQHQPQVKNPKIHSFKGWRSELINTIEAMSKEIAKSDETKLQISPIMGKLYFNFYFTKGNREWNKRHNMTI